MDFLLNLPQTNAQHQHYFVIFELPFLLGLLFLLFYRKL
ncbi:LPXTG cell wall anchor domain-containing protein [Chishuiella sp.]